MEADKLYNKASEIVEEKINFYKSLTAYIFITSGLVAYNIYLAGHVTWSKWVVIGWGLGIAIHWQSVFFENGFFNKKTRDKMIQKEMKKLS